MRLHAALLSLPLLALTGCGQGHANGAEVNGVHIVKNGEEIPEVFPEFTRYPGATIDISGVNDARAELRGLMEAVAVLTSPDDAAVIADYYRRSFPANGWTIIQSFQKPDGTLIMAESPYRQLVTAILRENNPTRIRLYYKQSERN